MKTMGLIGGMSWESTLEYYRIINEEVKNRLGGMHSAELILYSVEFAKIERLQSEERWGELAELMTAAAKTLETAGAGFLIICANTMHKVADAVRDNSTIPLLHIVDVVGERVLEKGLNRIGLLGTRFTMEEPFYKDRLKDRFGIDVIIPDKEKRGKLNEILYNELCLGIIDDSSRKIYKKAIKALAEKGAQGVILGCTEIPLLIKQEDVGIPVLDTTAIHARAAVGYSLE